MYSDPGIDLDTWNSKQNFYFKLAWIEHKVFMIRLYFLLSILESGSIQWKSGSESYQMTTETLYLN